MAWPIRFWSSIPDPVRAAILIVAAIAIGLIAWSGEPRLLPAAMLLPALWALAPSRRCAALVVAGYFLAASRGLPQGVANYYGSNGVLGFVLWVAASSAFVLMYGTLWSLQAGWRKVAGFGAATATMSIPPLGIAGWAAPITAAGVLFPGAGWMGLMLCAGLLLAMATSKWPVALAAATLLWAASIFTWTGPTTPKGWIGIDTHFRGVNGQYAGYQQQFQTMGLVHAAIGRGYRNIVLPESALGIWTPTTEHLWTESLSGTNATVIAGAVIVNGTGYDNVMVEVAASGSRILYRERMPVPISMWQPWLSWTGQTGGARADFFANPVVYSHGERMAVLICYEQLLVWPMLQSMLDGPKLILASSNGWWTAGTDILGIQEAVTVAWARLFGLPMVSASNI